MAKKKRYNYIRKKIARGSAAAVAADAVSLLLLVAVLAFSVARQGEGPQVLGAVGLLSITAALWAGYFVFGALRDEGANFAVAKGAGIGAAFILLVWAAIIVVGLS